MKTLTVKSSEKGLLVMIVEKDGDIVTRGVASRYGERIISIDKFIDNKWHRTFYSRPVF